MTIAELLKAQGYVTGQFGKNHLGDRDEHLPTAHGFGEFYRFSLPPRTLKTRSPSTRDLLVKVDPRSMVHAEKYATRGAASYRVGQPGSARKRSS